MLQRCQYTFQTTGGHYLASVKIQARQEYYFHKKEGGEGQQNEGVLRTTADCCEEEMKKQEQDSKGSDDDLLQNNPMNMMMDGMKGNMFFMVQNMAMMQGIQHFFSGFILLKMPFPLTLGFKQMFQRGVELTTLDTSYVSSVSWYFLVMYGLRDFFRLVIGDGNLEGQETALLQRDLGFPPPSAGGPAGNQSEAAKMLRQEAENLELFPTFKSNLDQVEQRLLGARYPKRSLVGPRQGDDGDCLYSIGGKKKKKQGGARVHLTNKKKMMMKERQIDGEMTSALQSSRPQTRRVSRLFLSQFLATTRSSRAPRRSE